MTIHSHKYKLLEAKARSQIAVIVEMTVLVFILKTLFSKPQTIMFLRLKTSFFFFIILWKIPHLFIFFKKKVNLNDSVLLSSSPLLEVLMGLFIP